MTEKEIPEKFKKIVEDLETMSVKDLAELIKILEERFGVKAAPQVISAPVSAAPQAQSAPAQEEKATFNVVLTDVGPQKIAVIKLVREITGKGLKESKDLVDAVASGPQILKEGVKKEEANEIKEKFEKVGAKIELK